MAKCRDQVRLVAYTKVAASGTGKVTLERVKPGRVLVCENIAWINETGTRGTSSLTIKAGGRSYNLADQATPTLNQWYYYPYLLRLVEGEELEVSQASCIANDIMRLHVVGYIEFLDEAK